jgi:hypothetical protein
MFGQILSQVRTITDFMVPDIGHPLRVRVHFASALIEMESCGALDNMRAEYKKYPLEIAQNIVQQWETDQGHDGPLPDDRIVSFRVDCPFCLRNFVADRASLEVTSHKVSKWLSARCLHCGRTSQLCEYREGFQHLANSEHFTHANAILLARTVIPVYGP